MTLADQLLTELTHEAATTRRVLERVPEDRLGWKPHQRSMSLGQLALHIAALPRGIAELATPAEAELPTVPLPQAETRDQILSTLDDSLRFANDRISAWRDEVLRADWTTAQGGRVLLQMPRAGVIRSILLNHWYHHRGQLTVYLRLLDVPVPPVYGPTADEQLPA